MLQKRASDEEDSADYTVRSYRVTIPGGASSDAIIVKSRVPTAKKLAEMKVAGELDGPIRLNDFGSERGVDLDQLHLRLNELIREAIAADLKINSKAAAAKTKNGGDGATTKGSTGAGEAVVNDEKPSQRALSTLERELAASKEQLQRMMALLSESARMVRPPEQPRSRVRPERGAGIRGPVVGGETEEKNRSDQADEDGQSAAGDAFDGERYGELTAKAEGETENSAEVSKDEL